jgi:type IV pilus assembly protein PilV
MSLIEVMVSVLVLGIGLLGIAAMQSLALRGGQSSLESSQAVMATNAIIEAMRANRANAAAYNGTYSAPPSGTTQATHDLNEWMAAMRGVADWNGDTPTPAQPTLGAATTATIAGCPAACVISLVWDDSRAGTDQGGTARTMVMEAQI